MGLTERAAAMARRILTNTAGFAVPVTLITPEGTEHALQGLVADIGHKFDVETQVQVAGRKVSVSVSLDELEAKSLVVRAVHEKTARPWVVRVKSERFRVSEVIPDQTLRVMVLNVESYR